MNKLAYTLSSAIVVLLTLSHNVTAQDNQDVEEVTIIGTRSEQSIADLATNISVLNKEKLDSVAPVHIQQVLSQVPGVSTQRGNGQESLPGIRSAVLTGSGACGSVLVLEEAIAVRGAGFCNVNELFDTHFEQASQIEVVRGPNTAFFGSNALNGSININLPSTGSNTISAEFGSNSFVRLKAAANYIDKEHNQGRIYATLSEDGGFRDDSGYKQQKFSWRHRAQVANFGLHGLEICLPRLILVRNLIIGIIQSIL